MRVKNFKPQKVNLFSAELVSKQLVLHFPTTALEELRFGRGNEFSIMVQSVSFTEEQRSGSN